MGYDRKCKHDTYLLIVKLDRLTLTFDLLTARAEHLWYNPKVVLTVPFGTVSGYLRLSYSCKMWTMQELVLN